ncbi:hypothetical protein niasHS_007260 [Heterodera schachtii]|uniref:Trafficking protein particle complex subunit 8 n=1 Tax=Heterodera schachtii TaxID=97005 RepID=A0ABD2JJU5_HETSC
MSCADHLEGPGVFCPLVAVLATDGANNSVGKNGLNLGDLLLPFSCTEISIRDPLSQNVSHRLRLDFRDIRRKGFLLENTVFRFILQESVLEHSAESNYKYDGQSILSKTFYSTFIHWLEPAEHEFLRAYIGCIFVASTTETDPLKAFEELDLAQRNEQQGIASGTRLSPAFCALPKWFFEQTLFKYYVLLHDNANPSDGEKHKKLFGTLCERYGPNNCHFLNVNSTNPVRAASDIMPDLWQPILARNGRGLNSGIELARRNLLSPSKAVPNIQSNDFTVLSPTPPQNPQQQQQHAIASTTASQLYTSQPIVVPFNSTNNENNTNEATNYHPLQFDKTNGGIGSAHSVQQNMAQGTEWSSHTTKLSCNDLSTFGLWMDIEDRQRLRRMVDEMCSKALVPFVEKRLAELHESVVNRKSLTKSTFSNMRKWLGGATANVVGALHTEQQQQSVAVSYASDSIELQMRRMADLAFLFGLYGFAYQTYQSLKKEFANDQAWLHHAGALEMAALSSFMSDWKLFSDQPDSSTSKSIVWLRKQYPQRYTDNAIHYYANVCRVPFLALRALMNSSQILCRLELFEEAAQQMISVGASLQLNSDLFDAILLEHAARLYFMAGNRKRKVSFYLATAAIRISRFLGTKAAQQHFQLMADGGGSAMPSMKDENPKINRWNLLRLLYHEVLQSSTIANNGWRWAEEYLLCLYMSCF